MHCSYPGALYHRADPNSLMNKESLVASLTPPYFHGVELGGLNQADRGFVKLFATSEFYKKAFQNRGKPLIKAELSSIVGGGVQISKLSVLRYSLIRFLPNFLFEPLKKLTSQ